MKTDANVLHLSQVVPAQSPTSPVGLPVALADVRDKAAQQLKAVLQALFDNADDTLFEMADRATSNAEQNALFEAMRDLRLKRRNIERGFLQQVFEAFAALNQYEMGRPAPLGAVPFDSLSLAQDDAQEEAVAVESMVARVMSRDGVALGHLSARFNAMLSQQLDDKRNPVGPTSLCESFLDACSSLGVEIRVKLIILKLFEQYVLGDLGRLYTEANQMLIAAGVLPEFTSAPGRGNPARASAPARAARSQASPERSAEGASEGVQDVFGALQQLLCQARGSVVPPRNRPEGALPISSNDLMHLLSNMQQRAPAQAPDDLDLREQLENLLTRAGAKAGEVDEDVINLVSMLFEFILDDRTLPDSLKALIGRLQIPMLKVAVIDKTFFSRGSHPARRLLNEIASAALGWGEQDDVQRDNLYQKIEQVVQRLFDDFVDDPLIFSELLAEFLAFIGDERRRSELLERRTRDAEEGRAQAALARREVEQALNARLLGKTLPEVVVRLLQEAWSKVLMLAWLRHGGESAQWQAALATMDDLVWSVQPHDEPEARMRLLERVPGLLKALREGMAGAALDPCATGDFFSQLQALHVQTFQRFKRSLAQERPQQDARALADTDEAPRAALADLDLPLLDLPAVQTVEEPAMVAVVEEIILRPPGELRAAEPEASLPDDDEWLLQVDNLRVGSWVEFQEDEEHKLRCKLAAVIKPTGKYIFVNRTGMKVLEKTRMGLALEFRSGAIRLLTDALLFDRALESVIGNLRELKGE
jgi:hypothetical protein